jgi:hypothetical protein
MIASAAMPAIPPIPLMTAPTFCAAAREGISATAPATSIRKQADGRLHLWEKQALDLGIEISVDVYPVCGLPGCICAHTRALRRPVGYLHCIIAGLPVRLLSLAAKLLFLPACCIRRIASSALRFVLEGLEGAVRAGLITERASAAGEAAAGLPVPLDIGSRG